MKRVSVLQDESDSVLQSGNWLNNGVNVVDATELCTLTMVKMANFNTMYILPQFNNCMLYYYTHK